MSKNHEIKKVKGGYTFPGLPDNYYLPTYELALKEYNYRKNRKSSTPSENLYKGASIKTIGGVKIDPNNYRRYVTQVRKLLIGKDTKSTKFTSNGNKALNLKAGELLVQTGKYYIDTKTFIPDLVSVDPSYKNYSSLLKFNNSNSLINTTSLTHLKTSKVSKIKSLKDFKVKSKPKFKSTINSYLPKNDLSFISLYILAYQNREQDPDKYNAFNTALARKLNKNLIWHGIWRGIDSRHTQELSDNQHELLYTIYPGTKNEMGQMNWYNIFNGNLLHATADDLSIPRSSLDYVSPEWRAKTMLLTNNPDYVVKSSNVTNSNNVDELIKLNLDLFKSLYEYAKQHNGAFNYAPSVFDTSKLNVNYKYGGIGDFMDTYGISPLYLYSILSLIYE